MSDNEFYEKLFYSNENILMHGPGGTGKTYDIKQYIQYLTDSDDKPIFKHVAPTGTAANNIDGMTIHSFFGFGVYAETNNRENDIDSLVSGCRYKPIGLQILIIDEISMVGYKMLTAIDRVLRSRYDCTKPMGGVRCIFSGDFYQLQPVKDEYCFYTDVWTKLNFHIMHYTEPKRYACPGTFDLLMRLRVGELSLEDKIWLAERVTAYKENKHSLLEVKPVIIYNRNDDVEAMNKREMAKLETCEYTYKATTTFSPYNKRISMSLDTQKKLLKDIVDEVCTLKVGANVMLYRNFNVSDKLTNGRLGIITEINTENGHVKVKFSDHIIHTITPKEYCIEGPNWRLSRTQIPLRPAWAITSHKCQGSTLDSAIVDLSTCFAKGQMYTTVARVKSINNLYIIKINYSGLKTLDQLIL